MIRRIALAAVVCALVAVAIWLPREEHVEADAPPPIADAPHGVDFRAERGKGAAPFVERWALSYPLTPPATDIQSLTLEIAAATGATASGRLSAGTGTPGPLLDAIAVALGGEPSTGPVLPPSGPLAVRLDLLGEQLSVGAGEPGATVIAGAFVPNPPGPWRVYRVTLGEGGPQCFLGLSGQDRAAVLLPRAIDDGPAILARFRSLLGRGPAAS